jgi:hypothetical protein
VNKTHTLEEEEEDEDLDPVVILTPIASLLPPQGCESYSHLRPPFGSGIWQYRLSQRQALRDYGSALHAAAHRGHTETVKYLVEAGADVNMTVEKFTSAPAFWIRNLAVSTFSEASAAIRAFPCSPFSSSQGTHRNREISGRSRCRCEHDSGKR